jgi:putative FmdB family regulatory protein
MGLGAERPPGRSALTICNSQLLSRFSPGAAGGRLKSSCILPASVLKSFPHPEVPMPRYEFFCEDCQQEFETILTLAEYEKGEVKCPKCGGQHVHQEAAAFFAVTSKKS